MKKKNPGKKKNNKPSPSGPAKFSSGNEKKSFSGKPERGRSSHNDRPRDGGPRDAGGSGGGFTFKDRAGKVHAIGKNRGGAAPAEEPTSRLGIVKSAPRPSENQPASRPFRTERPASGGFGGSAKKDRGSDRNREQSRDRDRSGRASNRSASGGRDSFKGKPARERSPEFTDRNARQARNSGETGGRTVRATVDKNRKGFAFLIPDVKGSDDFFVPPREAERFFHGDRVEATVGKRGEIYSVKVLNHRFRELFGKFTPDGRESGWIIYEKKRAREEVFVEKAPSGIKSGDWVHAKLHFHETGRHPVTGEIVEVFGSVLPARIDVEWIAGEYNLIEKHPPEAVKEAESFKLDLSEVERGIRKDLRDVPFITIDGETARDFDDAVYVERKGSGFILWVAIADVSFYVKPGTVLDKDARSRGTSVYFPERAFHMLPRALSEGLCSLKPKEPRLALVAKMDYDSEGKRTHTEVMDAVIESKRRATYNEIQKESELHGHEPKWEYRPQFDLYRLIRKQRNARGSIDFDLPEAEVLVDDKGEPTRIFNRARQDSHRLIEEFMISANEAVTEWALAKSLPFLYRVHDVPSEKALERFKTLAEHLGVSVSLSDDDLVQDLADFIRKIEGHPAQAMMNTALLRSMKQAVYSSLHGIHFGLASPGYTHFTSPIRRYPDLVVHRMLRMAIRGESFDRERLEQELLEIAEHCSYRERLASDADREAIKLKQVRIMMAHLGEEFEGKVIGVLESGFFVQLDEPYVEGMVPIDTMDDDAYEYDEGRMWLLGRSTRRIIQIGDRVKVQVARAELEKREIDFSCVEHIPQKGLAGETSMNARDRKTTRPEKSERGGKFERSSAGPAHSGKNSHHGDRPGSSEGGMGRRKKKSSGGFPKSQNSQNKKKRGR